MSKSSITSKNTDQNFKRDGPRQTFAKSDGEFYELQGEPFWKNHPALWFSKIEAQLEIRNIKSDKQKFRYALSLLDEETAVEVRDIIIDPPSYSSFFTLKKQLVKRFTAKNEEKTKNLMVMETMGDRKPSEFYTHLNSMAGCFVRDNFVKEVWISCLPSNIRSVVECIADDHLETVTKVADWVHEALRSPKEQVTNILAPESLLESLVKEVESLNKKVQILQTKVQPWRAHTKGKDVQHCDSLSSKNTTNVSGQGTQNTTCRYHTKYGVKICKMR